MLTVLAGSILFCVSAYVGFSVKRHYKTKMETLKDMKDFCDFAENKITLLKEPVVQILYEYASLKSKETQRIFTEFARSKEAENSPPTCKYLDKVENQILFDFLNAFGKSDLKNEVVKIRSFKTEVSSLYENSVKLYQKKGVMYYKLSVLAGIALMLLVC